MIRFDFTKDEVRELCNKLYLSDIEKRVLEYRLLNYSIAKMAILEHCSEPTISRIISKLKKKILKVL